MWACQDFSLEPWPSNHKEPGWPTGLDGCLYEGPWQLVIIKVFLDRNSLLKMYINGVRTWTGHGNPPLTIKTITRFLKILRIYKIRNWYNFQLPQTDTSSIQFSITFYKLCLKSRKGNKYRPERMQYFTFKRGIFKALTQKNKPRLLTPANPHKNSFEVYDPLKRRYK